VLGSDARTDIAVVSVGAGHDLVVAALALDEPLEVGQYTVAIGSPFELQQTVTSGIVSAINRPVYNGTGWNAMVQTDAAINPGNSGGALADREGRVIGINTAIQTDGVSSTNAGIGFAMPITTAYEIAGRLLSGESLDPGFLGISGGEPGTDEVGVAVVEVTPGSAAADAGLLVGDRVLSLDGAPVSGFEQLAGLIQTSFPGEIVVLQVIRDGAVIDVEVTLGER
jgi:S1-C subfamily serine protease